MTTVNRGTGSGPLRANGDVRYLDARCEMKEDRVDVFAILALSDLGRTVGREFDES